MREVNGQQSHTVGRLMDYYSEIGDVGSRAGVIWEHYAPHPLVGIEVFSRAVWDNISPPGNWIILPSGDILEKKRGIIGL